MKKLIIACVTVHIFEDKFAHCTFDFFDVSEAERFKTEVEKKKGFMVQLIFEE